MSAFYKLHLIIFYLKFPQRHYDVLKCHCLRNMLRKHQPPLSKARHIYNFFDGGQKIWKKINMLIFTQKILATTKI